MHKNRTDPCDSFFMVNKASGMYHGRVRLTTTRTTSHSMAAILQLIPSPGLSRTSLILTSMLWLIDTCQNKVSADQVSVNHIAGSGYIALRSCVFWKFTGDEVLVFAGSCQVNIL